MNKSTTRNNLPLLDGFRGLAAFYVLFGHAGGVLQEGHGKTFGYLLHPWLYSNWDKCCMYFFGLFKFGHQAVLFFFVLSGFVIHWSTIRQIEKSDGRFHVGSYLFKRAKRIYPPLLAALVLLLVLEYFGKGMGLPIYFGHTPYPAVNAHISGNDGWQSIVGNLFFVQGIYTPLVGTDQPLWSLAYEGWFYILYIPILFLFRKNRIWTSLGILVLWVINARFNLPPLLFTIVFQYFLSWYIGMVMADYLYRREKPETQDKRNLFFIFLGGVFVVSAPFYKAVFAQDTLLAIPIALILYYALTTNTFTWLKKIRGGDFSYTLYVTHFPILVFMGGLVMQAGGGRLPIHFGYSVLGIAIAIPFAWLLHFIIEKPFTSKKGNNQPNHVRKIEPIPERRSQFMG